MKNNTDAESSGHSRGHECQENNTELLLEHADCLVSLPEIGSALDNMANDINQRYAGTEFLAMCILNGGIVFAGHILPRLTMPVRLDYIHGSRYQDNMVGVSAISILAKPRSDLSGKHVLLLDDIFDEGRTLESVVEFVRRRGAASVLTAVLATKNHDRKPATFRPDFSAVQVPDRYVFGMGMDRRGYWRNAPGIFALKGE